MNPSRLIFSLKGSPHYVVGSHLSDHELRNLSPETIALSLEGADINDEGLLNLPLLPALRCLDLDGTKITDSSMHFIAMFPSLEELWLECTGISDEGLKFLQACSKLRFVSVAYSSVTADGVAQLARAIHGVEIST